MIELALARRKYELFDSGNFYKINGPGTWQHQIMLQGLI